MTTTAVRAEPPPRPSFAQTDCVPSRALRSSRGLSASRSRSSCSPCERDRDLGGVILAGEEKWTAVAVLAVTTLSHRLGLHVEGRARAEVPDPRDAPDARVPGDPIFYTVNVAFTNYSTGHILSKSEAIDGIKGNSLAPPPDGKSYLMTPARAADGELVLLLVDEDTGDTFVGTTEELDPDRADQRGGGRPRDRGRGGLHDHQGPRAGHDRPRAHGVHRAHVRLGGDQARRSRHRRRARADAALRPGEEIKLTRIEERRRVQATTSKRIVHRTVGWRSSSPAGRRTSAEANFDKIIHNPLVRDPFLRVFVWTFAFAFLGGG